MVQSIGDVAADVREDVEHVINDAVTYLASPRGKELRSKLSMGVIAVAPVIARSPIVRRHPVLRLLGVAGLATVLVKVAEAVRDWEPEQAKPSV
ncbi:MAG: hypothetical protein WEB06_19340 [Actinomycetota bacterium]